MNTAQLYQVTVYIFNTMQNDEFTGEFWAITPDQAEQNAKEFYAHENDTTVDQVRIANIKAI